MVYFKPPEPALPSQMRLGGSDDELNQDRGPSEAERRVLLVIIVVLGIMLVGSIIGLLVGIFYHKDGWDNLMGLFFPPPPRQNPGPPGPRLDIRRFVE